MLTESRLLDAMQKCCQHQSLYLPPYLIIVTTFSLRFGLFYDIALTSFCREIIGACLQVVAQNSLSSRGFLETYL